MNCLFIFDVRISVIIRAGMSTVNAGLDNVARKNPTTANKLFFRNPIKINTDEKKNTASEKGRKIKMILGSVKNIKISL